MEGGGEGKDDGVRGGNPHIQHNQTFAPHHHFPLLPLSPICPRDNGLNIQHIFLSVSSLFTLYRNVIFQYNMLSTLL